MVGDIIDWEEQKQAAKNAGHAAVVAKNVKAVLEGRKPTAVYKGSYEIILVTVGKVCGILTCLSRNVIADSLTSPAALPTSASSGASSSAIGSRACSRART